jgi:hypothetical protein
MVGTLNQLSANVARQGIAVATSHFVAAGFAYKAIIAAWASSDKGSSHGLFNR